MKRILILTNYPSDLRTFTGGVETATAGLIEGLKQFKDKFRFHIAALDLKANQDKFFEKDGIIYYFLAPLHKYLRPRSFWTGMKVFKLISTIKPDLIHINGNIILGFWALFSKIKKVYAIHGIPEKEKKVWTNKNYGSIWLESKLQKIVFRNYKYYVLLSENNELNLSTKQKMFIIPNPVRQIFLSNLNNSYAQRFRILFIGGLSRMKGVDILIKAAESILKFYPYVILTLIGEKKDEIILQLIEDFKKKLHKQIEIYEPLTAEELIKFYDESIVFVLLSLQENQPITLLEASARGVPVIATNIGSIPDIIEHGKNGFLVSTSDVFSVHNLIKLLIEDTGLWNNLSNNGKNRVIENFTPELIASKIVSMYLSLIENDN